ncbi:MAG: putative toxin-antitoxin system toxin component, PIN family [bacterium]|nr:putative toxin-antitoxin system toxin component, PIN family [bacterium]
MSPLREVLDPGVLVSGAISPQGSPDRILHAWQGEALDLVVCPRLLDELALVLRREKFRTRLPHEYSEEFLSLVADLATLVPDPREVPAVTRDPKYDYLLAVAREAGTDHLVSGDRRHLPPDPTASPPIITPAQLVELLDGRGAFERTGRTTQRTAQLAAWRARRSRWQVAHRQSRRGRERGD